MMLTMLGTFYLAMVAAGYLIELTLRHNKSHSPRA